jgi:endonuclease YncB( thermonuclease family)/DNA uptake protein ComE-like DNA-binding protein
MKKLFRKPSLFSCFLIAIIIIFLLTSFNAFSKTYAIKDKEGNIVKITNIYKLSLSEKEAGYTISVLVDDTSSKDIYTSSTTSKILDGVTNVIDGDTINLFLFSSGSIVSSRLNGIDCPEKGQPFYEEATKYASDLCLYKQVSVIKYEKDKYDRLIVDIVLPDGKNLSEEIVRAGFAWWYHLYSDNLVLKQLENEARVARRGLWSQSNPIPPWEFRQLDTTDEVVENDINEKKCKIKIVDWNNRPSATGNYIYIEGCLENIGEQTAEMVRINVKSLDSNDKIISIDSAFAQPSLIASSEEAIFQIMVENNYKIKKFSLIVLTESTASPEVTGAREKPLAKQIININTASLEELMHVLEISENTAIRVINRKNDMNGFKNPKDIMLLIEIGKIE